MRAAVPKQVARSLEYGMAAPKSFCKCGHLGDGSNSDHEDGIQPGHGKCKHCACATFTWKAFTPEYGAFMAKEK